jgi:hypothetical protein
MSQREVSMLQAVSETTVFSVWARSTSPRPDSVVRYILSVAGKRLTSGTFGTNVEIDMNAPFV